MNLLLVVLRLLHIVLAFAWFGLGMVMTLYIGPTAAASGETGVRFLKALYTRTPIGRIVPIVAGLTTLAGILLYIFGNVSAQFSTTGNIVLGIGAIAGILATGHTGAATGRAEKAYIAAVEKDVPETGSIPANVLSTIQALGVKVMTNSRISFAITVVALICMGSARYL